MDPELVLCGLSMVPISFTDLVGAAATAGFDAISVGAAIYRRAIRDGLTPAEMKRILDDHGVWVSEVEGVGNWLTEPEDKRARWASKVSDDELLDLALELGARTVLAVHFGNEVAIDEAGQRFGALCDRLQGTGIAVGLEFVAFGTIADLKAARAVVEAANRPNGGIVFDTWHYYRGRPDDAALDGMAADRVFSVQLADGDAEVAGSLEDYVLKRRLPGQGDLGVASAVSRLAHLGVRAPIGVEVWDPRLLERGPERAARLLYEATTGFLASISTSTSV